MRSTTDTSPSALVVIATYNEAECISSLVEAIVTNCSDVDILIVDDNSPDGTGLIADSLSKGNFRVHTIHRPYKVGLADALIEGFQFGIDRGYRWVLNMDADFSHDPESVSVLLNAAHNADLVIGSRYIAKKGTLDWNFARECLSRSAGLSVRLFTGLPLKDPTSGFRCFSTKTLKDVLALGVESRGYSFHIELAYKCWKLGSNIHEIPIVYKGRKKGASKMSWDIVREAIQFVLKIGLRRHDILNGKGIS